jgi:hypothetical protein
MQPRPLPIKIFLLGTINTSCIELSFQNKSTSTKIVFQEPHQFMARSEIAIPQHRAEINLLRVDQKAEIITRDENVNFSRPNFNGIYINVDRIYTNVKRTLQSHRTRNVWGWTTSALESVEGRNVAHILRLKNITLRININSHADKQFTETPSGTGAIRRRTTHFLILTVTIRTGCVPTLTSKCTGRMWNMTEVHGPPDDKQSSV